MPPYLRLVAASAWLNDLNILGIASGAMPMPVSATETCSSKPPSAATGDIPADSDHAPRLGEFDRVVQEVQ